MSRTNIVLTGFQACGKTTLGKLAAEKTGMSFIDTDRLIEAFHPPLTCRDIFKKYGEDYFRSLEKKIVHELTVKKQTYIALGGGTLTQEVNYASLNRHARIIYIRVDPFVIKHRLWQRPYLPATLDATDTHQSFAMLYIQRTALYEKYADVIIDTTTFSIEEAVELLVQVQYQFK